MKQTSEPESYTQC